jgi:hypothetical protein
MLNEILRPLDRCPFCADLKAACIDRQDKRSAASFGRARLGRIFGGGLLSDELRGHDLAALAVDRNLKRLGTDATDGIALRVDDLNVHGDDVNRAAEDSLRRDCDDRDRRNRRSEQQRS